MGIKTAITTGRRVGMTVLCWLSLILSILAGPLLARTFIGDGIRIFLEKFPWDWLSLFVLVVLVCFFFRDMIKDGKPNYLAIGTTLVAPSVASANNGKLSSTVADWTNWVLDLVADPLYRWLGTGDATKVAFALTIAALIFAQGTVKKSPSSVTVEA